MAFFFCFLFCFQSETRIATSITNEAESLADYAGTKLVPSCPSVEKAIPNWFVLLYLVKGQTNSKSFLGFPSDLGRCKIVWSVTCFYCSNVLVGLSDSCCDL